MDPERLEHLSPRCAREKHKAHTSLKIYTISGAILSETLVIMLRICFLCQMWPLVEHERHWMAKAITSRSVLMVDGFKQQNIPRDFTVGTYYLQYEVLCAEACTLCIYCWMCAHA